MTSFVPVYRRRPSALHAARAGAGAAFCGAFGFAAMLYEHPVVLAGALAGVVAAGVAAGVAGELRRAARLALPLALLIALVNPIAAQDGQTLLVRGGSVWGWGLDVTLEELTFGGVAGLRVLVIVMAFGLFSAAVDPDEVLRLFRRFSFRSALTAALATRLVPVLARDALRMSDASRCRAEPPGRTAVARAALSGALERAVDLAAALEVRGYAGARRGPVARQPWSRHDAVVAACASVVVVAAVIGKLAGAAWFWAYPTTTLALGPAEAALAVGLAALAVVPFAGASGRMGVARA